VEPRTQGGHEPAADAEVDGVSVPGGPESLVATATASARRQGHELGCAPLGAGSGSALAFVAAACRAKVAVEVGTGAGVSGLYLLAGMPRGGVLTSIDVEPEHQRAARRAFAEAGFGPGRTRLIIGRGLDVLPRLTDGGYDLVFVDAPRTEYPRYHEQAIALLRPGGVLVFAGLPAEGQATEPARSEREVAALRQVLRAVRENDGLVPALLPLDAAGLLVAAKRG
jgi:predicted O-methyltransferase YrrM